MKYNLNIKYKIGQVIDTSDRLYKVIGFEYVEDRGIRYILLTRDENKITWEYLFDFEIRCIKE